MPSSNEMPLSYRYLADERLVLTVGSGLLTDAELGDHVERLFSDASVHVGAVELVDLRHMEPGSQPTCSGVLKVARQGCPWRRSGSRMAMVAASSTVFGLARMFGAVHEGQGVEVWVGSSLDEAMAWLGLGPARERVRGLLEPPDVRRVG